MLFRYVNGAGSHAARGDTRPSLPPITPILTHAALDSYPVPAFSSSAQDYFQPNRSYSYYDHDGIDHDFRYPQEPFAWKATPPPTPPVATVPALPS